eukprot:365390-Chlamydomonas_euryale.AAC.29
MHDSNPSKSPCTQLLTFRHDSGNYDASTKTGGANASIRFEPEMKHGGNAGLVSRLRRAEPCHRGTHAEGYGRAPLPSHCPASRQGARPRNTLGQHVGAHQALNERRTFDEARGGGAEVDPDLRDPVPTLCCWSKAALSVRFWCPCQSPCQAVAF